MAKEKEVQLLSAALKKAHRELKAFKWLAKACGSYTDLNNLLDKFMNLITKIMRVEGGSLLLLQDNKLYFKVAKGEKAHKLKEIVLEPGEGIVGYAAKTGSPILVNDVKNDPVWTPRIDEITGFKTKSVLAVPLKVKEKIIGAVEVVNPIGAQFTTQDLDMLTSLSSQVAMGIENVRLLGEASERFSEINALFDVSRIITSSLAQETLLTSIMKSATRMLEVEAISLLLIDEATNELVFRVVLGEKSSEIKEFRIPINESSIAGWVAKNGKPLIVNDVAKDSRFNAQYSKKIEFKTKSILCVPLKIGERIIGVAEAINKLGDASFTVADEGLFSTVANQIAMATENTKLNQDLRDLFFSTVRSLVTAIEAKDPYTKGHSERVTDYTLFLARALNLQEEEIEILHLAGLLHDIGKIGVMEGVLGKKEKLTEEDWKAIKQHPVIGAKILEPVKPMARIIPYILHHHERYDGKGYPDGLKGEDIPFYSRMIAIGDTFDAMTSDRPYRKGLPVYVALDEIKKNTGIQFDPRLAEIFVKEYKKKMSSHPIPSPTMPEAGCLGRQVGEGSRER